MMVQFLQEWLVQRLPPAKPILTRQQRGSKKVGIWLCAKENPRIEEKQCPVPDLVGPAQRRSGPMAIELPDGRSESNDVLEALRLRAVHARELGYAVVDIAAILGIREETVSRWCVKYEQGGAAALPGARTGRPVGAGRRLSPQQEQAIQGLIDTPTPQELGIAQALWTRPAVRELIRQQTGRSLPIRTVGQYLARWGYTPQKPVRKAS